ncbi:proteasome assembly chaperone family protein [[Eubacterium] cellulosolvens]
MGNITIHEYKEKDLENAMVVVSFPTVGLVSSIVANFLVTNMNLELIAGISSDDFYPAAIISDGIPTPPVRIFAGDSVCGPEEECDQLVVITSELPVRTAAFSPLADRIIEWCKEKDCKIVTTLEGIQSKDPLDDEVAVFHVASNKEAAKYLKNLPSKAFDTGMVSGLSGILLYKGNLQNFNVSCLLAEAHAEYPDSRSAAELLKVLDKMVPQIKMDPEPLLKEAEKIEEQIKEAMAQIKPMTPAELPDTPPGMYG